MEGSGYKLSAFFFFLNFFLGGALFSDLLWCFFRGFCCFCVSCSHLGSVRLRSRGKGSADKVVVESSRCVERGRRTSSRASALEEDR